MCYRITLILALCDILKPICILVSGLGLSIDASINLFRPWPEKIYTSVNKNTFIHSSCSIDVLLPRTPTTR